MHAVGMGNGQGRKPQRVVRVVVLPYAATVCIHPDCNPDSCVDNRQPFTYGRRFYGQFATSRGKFERGYSDCPLCDMVLRALAGERRFAHESWLL